MADDDPTIEIKIRPDGSVHFEVSGVPGAGCEELEALLLEALQGEVTDREHTPEYHQRAERGQSAGLGQRLRNLLKRG